ncbi:MAG: PhzF family phenazine biosynthesis protein, partial [Thermodesulfobacteriota bacterium]
MVTSASDLPEYDFVCRFFGPASGIDEDPATGSAYCCLGPYWEKKLGKSEFLAYQASGRGGVIGVRVLGERVKLMGKAVTIFKGVMCV